MRFRPLTSPITQLTQAIDAVLDTLVALEKHVVQEVAIMLEQRQQGVWTEADDNPHCSGNGPSHP